MDLNNIIVESIIFVTLGFGTGIINTLAGGGSLLSLPILIFYGLDPSVANGTNRVGIFFQSCSSILGYKSKKINTYPLEIYLSIPAVCGAIIGSQIAIDIKSDIFNKILVIVMFFVVGMIIFNPKPNFIDQREKTTGIHFWISMISFFFIGIYGGFIQAGTGYLIMFTLSVFNRMSLVRTNAIKSFTVFAYMIFSLGIFIFNDKIVWKYGLLLALGGAIGSWVSSRWSVHKGDKPIKVFLIIAVIIMGVKLWFF